MTELKTYLRFHDVYTKPILAGEKTDTWRRGDRFNEYTVGQIIDLANAHDNDAVFGKARIHSITLLKLQDADEETAHKHGYKDKTEFIESFKSIYPDIQSHEIMTIIEFNLTERIEQ